MRVLRKAHAEFAAYRIAGKPLRKNSIFVNLFSVYTHTRALVRTGIPDDDWRGMRRVLQEGACVRLQEIAEEVRNVRVLDRGTYLRQALAQDWRDHGEYRNALAIARQAFIQEHFSTASKPEAGVVVMNMHKAKGKQFDEVIIFEGWPTKVKGAPLHNPDRIVRFNSKDEINDQARQTFRVSVTRAKRRTTILTPQGDRRILLGS
jgi:DNA helicase II / ATP-dependent DNA helicase PcrA